MTFVALRKRPASGAEAAALAAAIRDAAPHDGTRVVLGDDLYGVLTQGTWDDGKCASIVHADVVETAQGLLAGKLKLPQTKNTHAISMTTLRELGARGLLDRDINGIEKNAKRHPEAWGNDSKRGDGSFRGPFDIVSLSTDTPTYPALWGHDAGRERTLVVQPDSEGQVRERCEDRAYDVWKTATRLHFNLDFRLNSQSLAACLTPSSALGGRAWPNFLMKNRRDETATVLWANTTLGLILFWWFGTTQQAGRSNLTISRLPNLPALDPRTMSDAQHARAQDTFEDFRGRPFLPANEAYRDPTRHALDEAVLVELLGLPRTVLDPLALSVLSGARNPPCTAARPRGRDPAAKTSAHVASERSAEPSGFR